MGKSIGAASVDVETAADLKAPQLIVGSRTLTSANEHTFTTYNPYDGRALLEHPFGCASDVDRAVRSARAAFQEGVWRNLPLRQRKNTLLRWADLVTAHAARLDAFDALEMGKPVSLLAFNATMAADLIRFSAEAADKSLGAMLPSDGRSTVMQAKAPRGVVAAIIPWNFPTYNFLLKAAPALAAGNSVVLKPSELASQSAVRLTELALEAGIPPGALNMTPGAGSIVGRALAEHGDVDMVTFTGSTAVGRLIMQYAGASNMKVVCAECGGKSPHIVFDDGLDIDQVADAVAAGILLNQGQVCSVGSRALVQRRVYERFLARLSERLQDYAAGDPLSPATGFGPLASRAHRDRVLGLVGAAQAEGLSLVCGGGALFPDDSGCFVAPTLIANPPASARICQDEVFGPVLCVLPFDTPEEAIALAGAAPYGLAAYIWTTQAATGFAVARALDTAITVVHSTLEGSLGPGVAYSGEPAKLSGLGVEGGMAGFEVFLRRQTVWFSHG